MEQLRSDSSALRSAPPRALVLVVDDEESICHTLTSVLEDEQFDTLIAHDGIEAIACVRENSPALVFLDIWMPGSDGIETLERIKEISPATEVIMMSGHATISNALEATKRGAFDFIEKPFHLDSVLLSVNRALERQTTQAKRSARPSHGTALTSSRAKVEKPLFQHPAVLSQSFAGRNLGQRTLAHSAILYGHCLHSGQKSGLVLEPLPPNSGIHFARMGESKAVPAFIDFVDSTDFATTLRSGSTHASTIEHLMAALFAYGISNLLIKCNGEVPIFDGSAREFCSVIESVGIEEQEGDWFEIAVDRPLKVTFDQKKKAGVEEISISPADEMIVSYELNYPAPVGRQYHEFRFNGVESFKQEISSARTFGFMKDIERLQRAGLAAGGRLDNFILIGPDRVVNTELRFPDELVRHKILDVLGDLFLIGRPLRGHVHARMTGHSDNVALLRAVRETLTDVEV